MDHAVHYERDRMDRQVHSLVAREARVRVGLGLGGAGVAANVRRDTTRSATTTSKSQLFHYFPDGKSDLLLAVARYEAQQVLDDQQPMLRDLTRWAAWLSWRDRVIEKYRAQGPGCPLSALTSQLGLADPATRDVITDLYARWHRYLADGVRASVAAGEIDPAASVDDAATAVLTAVAGGATLLMATGEISYLETALGEAVAGLG